MACIHRGKQSGYSGWAIALSWWGSAVRLYLPGLEVCLIFPRLSHYCGRTFSGQTSWNICIQNAAKKEEERRLEKMRRHASSQQVLLISHVFVPSFSFCPTSRFQTAAWISSWFHPDQEQTKHRFYWSTGCMKPILTRSYCIFYY